MSLRALLTYFNHQKVKTGCDRVSVEDRFAGLIPTVGTAHNQGSSCSSFELSTENELPKNVQLCLTF
ncbi:hypothetical protein BGP_0579 [Beggiatoa sp. PS]|nr:hypothetical protein BGP_0579 [Beggiatoa sp. PS]